MIFRIVNVSCVLLGYVFSKCGFNAYCFKILVNLLGLSILSQFAPKLGISS